VTTATKGTFKRSIKRGLRALAYALLARWLQKHGITIPMPEAVGAVADPGILEGAANVAALMGADKGLREKWSAIKARVSRIGRWLNFGD
jgi:hypothetical protein